LLAWEPTWLMEMQTAMPVGVAWRCIHSRIDPSMLAKALCSTFTSLASFRFAVPGGCLDRQRVDQTSGDLGHFIHGAVKARLVRVRGVRCAAQLSHELQRRSTNFLVSRGRGEVRQRFDVPAHVSSSRLPAYRTTRARTHAC